MPDEQDRDRGQLPLFEGEAERPASSRVGSAQVPPEVEALARKLPAKLHLGTSSWSFPGWAGIVYDRHVRERDLAREGLAAYAQHPLLGAVGLDRTYWAPIPAETFADYAASVPEKFRFIVKAHAGCTSPRMSWIGDTPARRREPNPLFLDPQHAAQEVIGPCVEGLGHKIGAILFQFPRMSVADIRSPRAFVIRLYEFLKQLPKGPPYAVELRNAELLYATLYEALGAAGVIPCFNVHPTVPGVAEQRRRAGRSLPSAVVMRWMLYRKWTYEEARDRHQPFNRIVDEDPTNLGEIADVCVEALGQDREVFVTVNNKAEGSAPLSVRRLAERIAAKLG
jgi:uncharacterized protein YecE (DUF72 family)